MKALIPNPYVDYCESRPVTAQKKLYIVTFGCQMNEYDSQQMAQILQDEYVLTDDPKQADLILINTCSIREKAENKVYSLVGRFKSLKVNRPEVIIGVAGCVAQQMGQTLLKKAPHLDIVFGPQGIAHLPQLIEQVKKGKGPACYTELKKNYSIPLISAPAPNPTPVRAFVTIMQGCDNFCTYCVVPFVRGREISRPYEDILAEVKSMIRQGAKEITLLGQNVNSYGKKNSDLPDFATLLRLVSQIEGLERLRFTTSHPKDLSRTIMECYRDLSNLCEHLHLPVQSGSNNILKRMNRHYTREHYLGLVDQLRSICPEITLTTDLIVGFPGETHEDFKQTIDLLEKVQFDQIFAFKYSPRPFTKAALFKDQVPEEEKSKRLTEVLELQREIGYRRYKALEGKTVEVLVEGQGKSSAQQLIARTRGNHVVNLAGPKDLIGKILSVTIDKACYHSLKAAVKTQESNFDNRRSHGSNSHVCACNNP